VTDTIFCVLVTCRGLFADVASRELRYHKNVYFMIGGYRCPEMFQFQWTETSKLADEDIVVKCNTEMNYLNWMSSDENDPTYRREECVALSKGNYTWIDKPCNQRHCFVCQTPGTVIAVHTCL